MRIVIWNCNNGMGKAAQIDYFQNINADIAILPEMKEANIPLLEPSSSVWITNNTEHQKPKGLGILAFNGIKLAQLERDSDMEIFIPLRVTTPKIEFNLLALWNFYYASKQGRFKGAKGESSLEWAAMKYFKKLFTSHCLVGGDWNFGPTFSLSAFLRLCREFEESEMKSLYHQHHQLEPSETMHSTFRSPKGAYHHLDHFFGSEMFTASLSNYEIKNIDTAVLSDHAPVVADFDL